MMPTANNYAETKWLRRIRRAESALDAAIEAESAFFKMKQSHGTYRSQGDREAHSLYLAAQSLRARAVTALGNTLRLAHAESEGSK